MNHVEVGAECEHALCADFHFAVRRFVIAVGFKPVFREGRTVPDAAAQIDASRVIEVMRGKADMPAGKGRGCEVGALDDGRRERVADQITCGVERVPRACNHDGKQDADYAQCDFGALFHGLSLQSRVGRFQGAKQGASRVACFRRLL